MRVFSRSEITLHNIPDYRDSFFVQKYVRLVDNFHIKLNLMFFVTDDTRALEGNGLRSEFAAFLVRSKIGDRKQKDLERIISRLEDEVAKCADEIMILEERLTDKLSYISLLEGKLEQKNSRMMTMQNEIKNSLENKAELTKQVPC